MEDHWAITGEHSISYSQTQSLRPCYWCQPSSCRRSLAGTGSSLHPAVRRTGCRQSRCPPPQSALPEEKNNSV